MGRIFSVANARKAFYYIKKNGPYEMAAAAVERTFRPSYADYDYESPHPAALLSQKRRKWEYFPLISIVVPLYETKEYQLREMIESCLRQTYENFELILADASAGAGTGRIVKTYRDVRIRYLKLMQNEGIAANTNRALEAVNGEYTGLLDHDDLLTPDALYEMVLRMEEGKRKGKQPLILYSDEDKCDGGGRRFYEPHFKEDFNLDLLLSNNYICHFLVIKTELIKACRFRPACDGAQDYDLVLRAAARTEPALICHIGKVLYHWRCHDDSTAANPQSKQYAYEAGRRALSDWLRENRIAASVRHTSHLGFYRIDYREPIWEQRPDIGAVGGPLRGRSGRIAGGNYTSDGETRYLNLPKAFSGYMHRAVLQQDADAVDIRNMKIRPELSGIYKEVTGYLPEQTDILQNRLWSGEEILAKSLLLGRRIREAGYLILWDPQFTATNGGKKRRHSGKGEAGG